MLSVKDIVDEERINQLLAQTLNSSEEKINSILSKAEKKEGLTLEEVAYLLNIENPAMIEKMFETAGKIKKEIYGERLVFFAPLYLSSYCVNDCEYCGFHTRNTAPRKKLTLEEVAEQVKILENMGHKRLLLEFGEHPKKNPIDYVTDVIKTIYATKSKNGEIRRVNINIAATTVDDYKKINEAGIGTYQLFQETYHRDTYEKMHSGPKEDYERQLFAHDRAMEAGIDDVGVGVLYGLYDYKFDTLALVSHSQYLDRKYNVGPHTISVPRFQPAETVKIDSKYEINEKQLLKVIAILRMAVPYTGMIISTRESPETRAKAFEIGISQTSAASRTTPGGYGKDGKLKQFSLQDHRTVEEVLESILDQGLIPSYCTACYRLNRTGETIMEILKAGEIHNLCRPNAILTFKEYLEDYASQRIKEKGQKIIEKYLNKIPKEETKKETILRLKRIENGERDLYF
ncbi:MAG: [FeFe] hydrogenase H-cluster radical SAM maturase HydG [Candidatus Pacebacteria bacterium]|nr:[FeFe] hydrogenase H-cluster radical SAM maturase HydG [Candidatus Paceibacterota bacterium]